MSPIETALLVLLYVVIFLVFVGGIVFILNRLRPQESLPLPKPAMWETKNVTRTYKNLTDEQVDNLMKEADDEFRNMDGLWKTSKVTVTTTSPAKTDRKSTRLNSSHT